ncbi:MAG: septal ring lytic transglycosylase RlpA family protein [Parvibaculum sp.]|uniref:septal ring lytic transglycosylase RlpA family protein n=1 Tax=Parvibaculum sp. TaxID=2024848 RepID=UPI003C742F82
MSVAKSLSGWSFRPLHGALALIMVPLFLAGCSTTKEKPSVPTGEGGYYKVGKPYQIAGVWYYPKEDERYDATGIGSWYGPQFHGKRTANGEFFDQEQLTAAHPTLPMPVLVRVTNLENGRSVVVRVNDRGPFVNGREIDLSRKAAELLGYDRQGTARVRVQFVGRAPLPGIPGTSTTQIAGQDSFTAPKPVMDESEKRSINVAKTTSVVATTLAPPPGVKTAPANAVASLPAPTTPSTMRPVEDAGLQPPEPDGTVEQVPVPPRTSIFVQAGSFRNFTNAESVRQKMLSQGVQNVQVSPTMVDGVKYYRVRVGPLSDVSTADASMKTLTQNGHAGARIVVE